MRNAAAALIGASVLALAGCAQAYVVDAAEYAADPECARIMLAAPDTIGGQEYRVTTSQATAAWGDEYAFVERCGVEPPGPTDLPCVTISTASGTADWIVEERDDEWVAITYGRSPAVEVTIPKIRADEAVGDVLAEFTPAAALAPLNGRACL